MHPLGHPARRLQPEIRLGRPPTAKITNGRDGGYPPQRRASVCRWRVHLGVLNSHSTPRKARSAIYDAPWSVISSCTATRQVSAKRDSWRAPNEALGAPSNSAQRPLPSRECRHEMRGTACACGPYCNSALRRIQQRRGRRSCRSSTRKRLSQWSLAPAMLSPSRCL